MLQKLVGRSHSTTADEERVIVCLVRAIHEKVLLSSTLVRFDEGKMNPLQLSLRSALQTGTFLSPAPSGQLTGHPTQPSSFSGVQPLWVFHGVSERDPLGNWLVPCFLQKKFFLYLFKVDLAAIMVRKPRWV